MATLCLLLSPARGTALLASHVVTKDNPAYLFSLGQIVATPNALDCLQDPVQQIPALLARHQSGDWGMLHEEDARANQAAIRLGGRIISSYEISPAGHIVWIITEADRSVTTLLLPDDY